MITAATKKGHQYYYCTNGKGGCDEHTKYMREVFLDEKLIEVFGSLHLSEQKIDLLYRSAKEKVDADHQYLQNSLDTLSKQLESLTTKESRLLDTFLADQISKEIYDAKILEIRNERVSLEKQISDLKSKQAGSTLELVKDAFLKGSRAMKDYAKSQGEEKRNLVSDLLWNLSVKDRKIAQVSYRSPYDILAKAPKNADISTLCARQDSNLGPRQYQWRALPTELRAQAWKQGKLYQYTASKSTTRYRPLKKIP